MYANNSSSVILKNINRKTRIIFARRKVIIIFLRRNETDIGINNVILHGRYYQIPEQEEKSNYEQVRKQYLT